MICRWCEKSYSKLAKSHIIPRAFCVPDEQYDRFLIAKNSYKKKRPIGSWDSTILCEGCERDYSFIDSNAAEVLLNSFEDLIIPFNNDLDDVAIKIDRKYEQSLKLFLIYTLWKASVSNLEEFKNISLGPYENIIRNDIISKKTFDKKEYSFIGCSISEPLGQMMPLKRKKKDYEGRTFYNLDLLSFMFDIKVDGRSMPNKYSFLHELEGVIFLKIKKPIKRRHQAMIDIVNEHHQKFGSK